ncbi:squalene synthase HpnC [Thalassoroseus pseudoceratinae]|uniref:squalene synthase HpnC n=1 Tax=Thalassoroseus pseudoceratinae TaxID=2713176 RepID=UPI00142087C4|nr:squalene synthase HpnC [Thalassoroseus pseudoceratinae]
MSDQFERELADWGPEALANGRVATLMEAEAYTRRIATTHYENFTVVSWLLPKHLRPHFHNVYAYCRWSDDLGDEVGDRTRAAELLDWWQSELEDCYQGTTRHPVFVALAETIREFNIPMEPFADLLSAFQQDQRILQYETFDQLRDYCRRSADPVGRLVLYLGRQHNEENVLLSDNVCTGLQLANFWQDVDRDWDIGRRYLPLEDFEQFGYTREEFERRETNPAFLKLMQFEVERARTFLTDGLPLITRLPGRLQVDIELFIRGGLKILERIERIGYSVWETRPVVTKADAARMFAGCVIRATGRRLRPRRSIAPHEHTTG